MISIIAPAYNEQETIRDFIDTFKKIGDFKNLDYELIIVNDGSKDNTFNILKELKERDKQLRIKNHKTNLGFGAALKTGIEAAKGNIIVTMDSDLTHPPSFVKKLVSYLEKNNLDVCVASRYIKGGGMKNVPFYRVVLSRFANLFFFIFLCPVKDVTSGFKAYSKKIKEIKIENKDFSVQIEIMTKLAKEKVKFGEIPFILVNREKGQSKFKFLKMLPKYTLNVLKLIIIKYKNENLYYFRDKTRNNQDESHN